MNVCLCCVRFCFFHTKQRDWLGKRLRNDVFCVECDVKTLTQSIIAVMTSTCVCVMTDMYSLYHPVLADNPSSVTSSTANVGYQVLAAASDGQLTLTEITPKLEKAEDGVEDVTVSAPEFCEVSTSELSATNLDMIVECTGST